VKQVGCTLIIRADADARMGTGHVMRCLALGQAWKDNGGHVVFITACSNKLLLERLYNEDFEVYQIECPDIHSQDWRLTKDLLAEYTNVWLVLDGYHFESDYQKQVKDAGYKLLVIDDMAHLPNYYADIVLNQNIHASELYYSGEVYTKLLLGTKYVLLRREFLSWRGWKREVPELARKVLITLGGSDPDNVTLKIIQALQQVEVDGLEAVVVAGPVNPHYEELRSAVQSSGIPIRLESNVVNMPELMAWADVAISGGGTTSWELAFMGLPSVVLSLADNQHVISKKREVAGVAIYLNRDVEYFIDETTQTIAQLLKDRKARYKMSQRGKELIDGEGVKRVIEELKRWEC